MYSPEIMQPVQKGIIKKAAFCLISPEHLGWYSARYFAWAGVCVIKYVVEVDLLRMLTFGARWARGTCVYWPHKRSPFGAGVCPCFPGTGCLNSWSCPICSGGQELEASQALGCPAGGWSTSSAWVCSSWRYCAWAGGSPCREAAEDLQTSLHLVWSCPFVLLPSFLSSGAPRSFDGSLCLVFQVHVQWIQVLPYRLFFAVSLAFLNSKRYGKQQK